MANLQLAEIAPNPVFVDAGDVVAVDVRAFLTKPRPRAKKHK
jgi:hypothetical protein